MPGSGSTPTVGQIVPDYELLRRIGGGAYGEVWLARSKATGVLRAAKIVWRHTFDDERPFQREFEGIQRFERISREHPSQLSLFHIGRNDAEGYFYYVMELADNVGTTADYAPRTLRADLGKGRLPSQQVLEISVALTEALGHLHQNGLVHRDVKPSNVIFVNGRPKLADIGLVTDASDTRSIVGTEGYLAPEGPGTPQADIFALGKVLYEAATGQDRRNFPDLPPQLKEWPDAPTVLEINEVILKSCAPAIANRYTSCAELRIDLEFLAKGKSIRQRQSHLQFWSQAGKIGLTISILGLLTGLIIIAWPRQEGRSSPSQEGTDSTNLEANALCDKAMYIMRGDNYAELGTAYSNFVAAAALDTNFVRAYVGLLELDAREDVPNLPTGTKEQFRSIARNLERLAPHMAATYLVEAIVNWSDWDYPEAMNLALKASTTDPKYELGHTWRAWLLLCTGWPEEARKEVEISRRLAPSQTIVYRSLGNIEFVERHYAKAIEWYKTTIKMEPHHTAPYSGTGGSYMAMGDYTNALEYFEKLEMLRSTNPVATHGAYNIFRHRVSLEGPSGYWRQQWDWRNPDPNKDCYWKATMQIHLGNTNDAIQWLQKSYELQEGRNLYESPLSGLLYDPDWDGVRDNPSFVKILDGMGYTKVMPRRK
ncbi:MAG TPA: protein kinase [Verrucomicrobiae bacterium]|jgi:serine/threonine protein kinase/Tfp pilus assembly protein PilF